MGALAKAGGTAAMGCNPSEASNAAKLCYFQVTPNGKSPAQITQDFVDAINKIRGAVASCEFVLSKPENGGQIDPSKINVVFTDGSGMDHVVLQDGTDGRTYDDPNNPTRVILHGKGCDTIKADVMGKISIAAGCKTQTK